MITPNVSGVMRRISLHDAFGRGAQLALFALLALFPLLLALLGLLSVFNLDAQIETLRLFVEQSFPEGLSELVMAEVERIGAQRGWPLTLTILFSAYYAGSGAATVIRGVEIAWGRAHIRPLRSQLLGTAIAMGLLVFAIAAFALLFGLNIAISWAASRGLIPTDLLALTLLRWPILLLSFHTTVRLAYKIGAGPDAYDRWFSAGSITATMVWLAMSQGFALYLSVVADLGATYGSLGGIVGLLLYLHMVSSSVFVGAEIDASRARRRQGEE